MIPQSYKFEQPELVSLVSVRDVSLEDDYSIRVTLVDIKGNEFFTFDIGLDIGFSDPCFTKYVIRKNK